MKTNVVCPHCHQDIVLRPQIQKDTVLACPHCQLDLVVTSVAPCVLDVALEGAAVGGLPPKLMMKIMTLDV